MRCNFLLLRLRKLFIFLVFFITTINAANSQNAIVTENALTGTPRTTWDSNDGDNIQGFASNFSVNKGETVRFKIDINSATLVPYTVAIYRIGYYQGKGARFITSLGSSLTGKSQPGYLYENSTGKVDCSNWTESCHWDVPANAVSGVYVARLDCGAVSSSTLIIFVVRDDAANSQLLFKTSDATWQAYNYYGGNTFYAANTPVPGFAHATKLSYQRPMKLRGNKTNFFNAEFPMLMWLERNGYDVSYATDMDMARDATVFTPAKHKILLSVGHDEYWSLEQRNKFETARNNGVNIAWFSANNVYWKTRWENNYQTLVCYKEGTLGIYGCGTKCDPEPNVWTGLWRDGCLPSYGVNDGCRPEGSLVGQMSWTESTGSIEVPDTYKNYRVWKNTSIASLGAGQKITFANGTLGEEWDQESFVETYPAHRIALSFTTLSGLTHRMSMYKYNSSGALVFAAGTMNWAMGLDVNHDNFTSMPVSLDMQQATYNVLFDMGAAAGSKQANIITAIASTDNIAPACIISTPVHNALVPGSPVTVSGTCSDNSVVAGVEVSIDNGVTWNKATGTNNWSYSFSPTDYGTITIKVRAWDDVFNLEVPGAAGSANCITIHLSGPYQHAVFDQGYPIQEPSFVFLQAKIELGMKFRTTTAGTITALRYYKSASGSGAIVGHLWSRTGTLLATKAFTNETASGWQTATLTTPIAVTANTTYVVSYYSPLGKYVEENPFFATTFVNGMLSGLADGQDGNNGVFNYGGSGFPTEGSGTSDASNYYADVLFKSSDVTAPQVVSVSPANNATLVGLTVTPSATFNELISPGTVTSSTMILTAPGNVVIPATASVNGTVVKITPAAALDPNTVYTVKLKGGTGEPVIKDDSGNKLAADYTWSFTTDYNVAALVTVNPGDQTVCANSTVSFTSAASGFPVPIVKWQVSTNNGTSWTDISGATNATYSFTAITVNNNNLYHAVWTNNSGTVISTAALLTVIPGANAGTISGSSPLCIGQTTTYTGNGTGGGTWSSTNTTVATVNATTGFVTAAGAGTTNITYTVSGCNGSVSSFKTLTVNPNVNAGTISGSSPLCLGQTGTYTSNGNNGGTWSSTNTTVATVNVTTGLVTVAAAGTTNITYTVSGCNGPASSFKTLTVNPNVNAGTISGSSPLCIGQTGTYASNGNSDGTWSSTNTTVATVNVATGLVTAAAAGTTNITYTVSGCNGPASSFKTLTVNPDVTAGTVSGSSPLCIGQTGTYTSNGNSGGTWSSTNTTVATVNVTTGLVTAAAAGTTNITYTVSGCNGPASSFKTLTVNPNVNAGTINGSSSLCSGLAETYTSTGDGGGTWTSSNTGVATVDLTTGLVTTVSTGTTILTYAVTGCSGTVNATKTINVTACATIVNLKLFLQGYYISPQEMQPVLLNQGIGSSTSKTDDITVELHDATTPFATVATTTGTLNTDGTVSLTFTPITGSYYIAVKHRNSLQTWSANPVTVGQTPVSYDFSMAANKAFGNNMIQIGAVWALYTGDINQDEFIDGFDYPAFDNDNLSGVTGVYSTTDMNGDGFVDGFDYPVFDNNNINGIESIHP